MSFILSHSNLFSTSLTFHNIDEYSDEIKDDPTDLSIATEKVKCPNIDSSCYINSIFQFLLHDSDMWDDVINHFGRTNLLHRCRQGYCDFAKIKMDEQCSSELFLHWMLEQLETTNKKQNRKRDWIQQWIDVKKCNTCGHSSRKKRSEHIWRVYPSEHPVPYVDEEMGELFEYDMIDCILNQSSEAYEMDCESCGVKGKHTVTNRLKTVGNSIFFSLQQFQSKSIKLFDTIDIGNVGSYDLKGIIEYKGNGYSGHYTAILLDEDGWTKYDDTKITKVVDIDLILSRSKNPNARISIPLLWYTKNTNPSESESE